MNALNALIIGTVLLILLIVGLAFYPDPECAKGYIYVWRARACLMGYRP